MVQAIGLVIKYGPAVVTSAIALYKDYQTGKAAYLAAKAAGGSVEHDFVAALSAVGGSVMATLVTLLEKDLDVKAPPEVQAMLDAAQKELASLAPIAPKAA